MKSINKILILFFASCFLVLWLGWTFIHSKKFSDEASKKVSEILTKKIGAQVSFGKVNFDMFPPSTTFEEVSVTKTNSEDIKIMMSLKKLGVYFTYSSFIGGNLEIDELLLEDGNLLVDYKSSEDEIDWSKFKIEDFFNKYNQYYSKSPVELNLLKIVKVNAQIGKLSASIGELSLFPHKKKIKVNLKSTKVKIDEILESYNIPIFDEVNLNASATRNNVQVDELKLKSNENDISFKGDFLQENQKIKMNSKLNFNIELSSLNNYLKNEIQDLKMSSGKVEGAANLIGDIIDFNSDLILKVKNLKSPYINLNDIRILLTKKKNMIQLEKLVARNNEEQYQLLKGGPFFDLSKRWFYKTKGQFEITNAFTNTFLYSIHESLDVVKAYVTAKVDVQFDGEKVYFNIDKGSAKDFRLILPGSKKPLLQNQGFLLESVLISLDSKNNLGINSKVLMADTLLKVDGIIRPKDINIQVYDSKINLKSFGPIGGINLEGNGPINLTIDGPMDDVRFNFDVNWKQFSLLDLYFGDVKSQFVLSLNDVMLSINNLTGTFNTTKYDANGWLKFGDLSGLDLKLNFPETNFKDAQAMYKMIFKSLSLPKDLDLKFSTKYRVFGDFDLPKLKFEGSIKGKDLKIAGEDADTINADLTLQNQELKFKNIKIRKSRGEINSTASVSIANGYSEVEASGNGIRLSDFNFYKKLNLAYDSDLIFDYDGNGTKDTFSSRLKFKTSDPFIGNLPASNSGGIIYINYDELIAKVSMFGNKLKLDSNYNLKNSNLAIHSSIDTTDMRELFGVISSHNAFDKKISGSLKASLNAKMDLNNFSFSKLSLDIRQFKLKRDEVNLSIDPTKNQIEIENGLIKKWNLAFNDGEEFFISKGYNTKNNGFQCEQNYNIKSNILELVHPAIERSRGLIKGNNTILVENKPILKDFKIYSSDTSLKIKKMPGLVSDLNYEIVKNGNRFDLNKFFGKYGEGDIRVFGNFIFESMYPIVNLEFKIDKSIVPLFKKSNIVLVANGNITGNSFPYNINAKASIIRGDILDDIEDMTTQTTGQLDEYSRYLPNKNDKNFSLINMNINFDTQTPVILKNNLLELYTKASGQILGDAFSPEINTRVEVQPSISKFKFKGHDFILNQGYVEIHDKSKVRNSDLKFVGVTKVNEYEIKLDVSGKVEKVNINFSSEPAKSQEDIISLLALGVTSDMNRSLDQNERASIARVGIGSLFLDQLKVNEDLNSSIGVNVSVLPEFQQEESSLISSGKAAVTDSSSNKLKSATKIKVNKKLTNKVDLSVSSTVGGTIEQKQEMNINVNVNKNISLEGVYELKSNEEDNANSPTSIGADLKFKWSF